jgi:plastocyanin
VVRDLASVHNFHLRGPGVNKKTSLARRVTVTWTLTLRAGTYRFVCDNHPDLRGSFRVT